MKKEIVYVGILLLGIALLSSKGRSQPDQVYPAKRDAKLERVRMLRTWKLIDALDLTEEQSTSFFPLLKAFDKRQDALKEQKKRLVRELDRIAESETSTEEALHKAIKDYRKVEAELFANHKQFYDDAGHILTLKQQAKLLVFEEHFKERLRGIIQDIRHQRRDQRMPKKKN